MTSSRSFSRKGGSETAQLMQIATSTQLGAPDQALHKGKDGAEASDGKTRPAVPSAAIDAVGRRTRRSRFARALANGDHRGRTGSGRLSALQEQRLLRLASSRRVPRCRRRRSRHGRARGRGRCWTRPRWQPRWGPPGARGRRRNPPAGAQQRHVQPFGPQLSRGRALVGRGGRGRRAAAGPGSARYPPPHTSRPARLALLRASDRALDRLGRLCRGCVQRGGPGPALPRRLRARGDGRCRPRQRGALERRPGTRDRRGRCSSRSLSELFPRFDRARRAAQLLSLRGPPELPGQLLERPCDAGRHRLPAPAARCGRLEPDRRARARARAGPGAHGRHLPHVFRGAAPRPRSAACSSSCCSRALAFPPSPPRSWRSQGRRPRWPCWPPATRSSTGRSAPPRLRARAAAPLS